MAVTIANVADSPLFVEQHLSKNDTNVYLSCMHEQVNIRTYVHCSHRYVRTLYTYSGQVCIVHIQCTSLCSHVCVCGGGRNGS